MNEENEAIEVKQDGKWTVSVFDYVVIDGRYFEVRHNDYEGELYLEEVDEIPEDYKEIRDDGQ